MTPEKRGKSEKILREKAPKALRPVKQKKKQKKVEY